MKSRLTSLALALLALSSTAFAAAPAGFKEIFNGKDLTGWEGLDFWSAKNGAIVGQTTADHRIKTNTFLFYKAAEPANFELRAKFRLTAQNAPDKKPFGNSGIQYRSKVVDAAGFVLSGYQADMDLTGVYTGMLYEEKGRGILMAPGEKISIGTTAMDEKTKKKKTAVEKLPGGTPIDAVHAAYKQGEWNEIIIIAEGNHLRHFINGTITADVTDTDATMAAKSGVIGLQLHVGEPMTIEFKDLYLKTLP